MEQAELRTGRRSEGIFFSASTFIRKSVQGLGVITASFVLTVAHFPKGVDPSHVSAESLWRLGAFYVPSILSLWLAMMAVMSTYKLTREDHEANVRRLAEGKAAAAAAGN